MAARVAVDIGGTFTDLVVLEEGADDVVLAKAATTPGQFETGVMDAVGQVALREVDFLAHGTTLVINALTERSGATTALITTRGFRDVLEIQKGNRPDLYNLAFRKPVPFVPRHLRFEVTERLDSRGSVLTPLVEEEVRLTVEAARSAGVEAIAVCLLHAYANPVHERRVAELARAEWPEVAISVSHELTGEWREYHRSSTVVLDAYVKPTVRRYLTRLGDALEQAGVEQGTQFAMRSNGGLSRFAVVAETPINLIESGPVGGIIGAAEIGKATSRPHLITLDIGGTTAKSSLIEDGAVRLTSDHHIERTATEAGYPVKVPVVDIVEIGLAGGSIAWMDAAGALEVGPRSAGAVPGPACYGRGGAEPTITDANLVAGRIGAASFMGGRMPLDETLARAAIGRLAAGFGTGVEETAHGILELANAGVVHLLRLVSVRRGRDPREFALVACGGGGPVHAAFVARELRIPEIVVPRAPGHFSALGMLMSDMRHDLVRTAILGIDDVAAERTAAAIWDELTQRMLATFAEEGVARDRIRLERAADLRYRGQEHTVAVPVPAGDYDEAARAEVRRRFDEAHERLYTFRLEGPAEFVNFRLTGWGAVRKPPLREIPAGGDVAAAHVGTRVLDLAVDRRAEADVYRRERLPAGAEIEGPAVIEEPATSTLVLPGMRCTVDRLGNLVVETGV